MEPSYREVRLDDLRSVGDPNPLDSDNSGRIERDEWNGMRTAFNRLDVNNDVALSRQEFSANDAVVAGSDDFDLLDTNSNGVISRGEWRDGIRAFNQYDLNGDGVVTRREYSGASSGVYSQELPIDARHGHR